jgi:hypothetical protein
MWPAERQPACAAPSHMRASHSAALPPACSRRASQVDTVEAPSAAAASGEGAEIYIGFPKGDTAPR